MTSLLSMIAFAFLLGSLGVAAAGSLNGSAGQMPAYYDGQLFTINFTELPPGGEATVLAQNKSINTIYRLFAGSSPPPPTAARNRPRSG
jgi:hypothetical protein